MTMTITHKYLRDLLDNLSEENFTELLMELHFSTLVMPATEYSGVPIVELKNEPYIPLFTDFDEFNKFKSHEDYMAVAHEFNDYLEFLERDSTLCFIINPGSEKFPITAEILEYMEPNYIFDQDYQPFTVKEIREIKNSICNDDLNEFLNDGDNWHDFDNLMIKMAESDLLTLLVSDKYHDDEDGVVWSDEKIPKCLYEVEGRNYILLFSRDPENDVIHDDTVFKYTQIVNLPLLIRDVLNYDFDGFILNLNDENITVSREHLRDYMKDFKCPVLNDFAMYAFPIEDGD